MLVINVHTEVFSAKSFSLVNALFICAHLDTHAHTSLYWSVQGLKGFSLDPLSAAHSLKEMQAWGFRVMRDGSVSANHSPVTWMDFSSLETKSYRAVQSKVVKENKWMGYSHSLGIGLPSSPGSATKVFTSYQIFAYSVCFVT